MLLVEDWGQYAKEIDALDQTAADLVTQFVYAIDFSQLDGETTENLLVEFLNQIINRYGDAEAELAAQMLTQAAENAGLTNVRQTIIPSTITETQLRNIVTDAIKAAAEKAKQEASAFVSPASTLITVSIREITDKVDLKDVASELAQAVRDAISGQKNDSMETNSNINFAALTAGVKRWYAYIPNPDACAYCVMVASNGWQETKRTSALEFNPLHENCNCSLIVDYGTLYDVKTNHNNDFKAYEDLYDECKVEGEVSAYPYKTLWQMTKKIRDGYFDYSNGIAQKAERS